MKTNKNGSILHFNHHSQQQVGVSTQDAQMFKTTVGEQQNSSTMLTWEQKQHLLVWSKVVKQSNKFNDKNIDRHSTEIISGESLDDRKLVDFLRRAV